MSRVEHFKDGSQPDMFADHFGAATGLSDPVMTADKKGRITYLGRDTSLSNRGDYQARGDYSPEPLHAGTSTALYPSKGNLVTYEEDGSGLAPMGSHEIDSVSVSSQHRRAGIASSMLQYARQFGGDIRHSMTRSSMGSEWSRAVGGLDSEGRDTSSYDYTQTYLIPELTRRATRRDARLTPSEEAAKASVPHPLGIDRMY